MGVVSGITNLAVSLGTPLQRWEKVHVVKLEKIPGRPIPRRHRNINLYQADLNLLIGIIYGRQMIEAGENQGIFGDEQWGSRRGRSAIDVFLLKHFTYMLMRLTKTNGGTFDNDAKACYNRMSCYWRY
jgi:hypothetical protein